MTTYQRRIRNVSIIAHVDHGKTALTESLAHIKTDVGMEEEKGITIKSASVTLDFARMERSDEKKEEFKQQYRINLIDSPGHVDFSSEVTAALRITDGAICVVDCIEGVCVQTETVLRQAILECVKPVLFINKIDRIWLEQKKKIEHLPEVYKLFKNTIESTNAICQTYKDEVLGDINLDPRKLNVGFGSGYFGYGFTLSDFAKMYTSKFSISHNKMVQKLWGNHYFDQSSKQWIKSNDNPSLNGFCEYVLKPVQVLHDSIMNSEDNIYMPIIDALNLNITPKEFEKCKHQKDILKLVMSAWLSTNKCVLDLCADTLPSPAEAQKYRIRKLYTGPLDTIEAQDMINCDANGKLSMYVSKMIPIEKSSGRFIAFGRVFSGTIKQGQELRILGQSPTDDSDEKASVVNKKKVQGIYKMMGAKIEKIQSCVAGDVCGVMGIDKYLTKAGTLCDSAHTFPFKVMKFSVSPVVNVAVEVVDSKKLKKLVEGLKRLSQYDNIVQTKTNKQGQMIVSGSGELHLQTCLSTLRDKFMEKVAIRTSNPITSFCEGINSDCGSTQTLPKNIKKTNWTYPKTITVKSPNRLNKLCFSTQKLSKEVCSALENNKVKLVNANMKLFGRQFASKFTNWHKDEAARIWTFGCAPYGKPNVLVDQTKGVQYLDTIKSSIVSGFRQVTEGGILCDEPLRGVRCDLADGGWRIHSDPKHAGPGQIIPATVRGIYAGLLSSCPILYEPMYCVDIEVPIDSQNGVFNTFGKVRGEFVKMEDKTDIGIPLCRITGYVPIIETLKNDKTKKEGFTELLRANTQGKAFPVMKFSHWQAVDGDVLCDGSISNRFVMDIRRRKGMKLEIPCFSDYYDKL